MAIKTFSVNEVLNASDTNTFLANSGLVFVKSQTIGSTVTSVTVSDAFNSTYDNYRIVISGVSATAAGSYLQFRLGSVVASQNYGTLFYDAYTGAGNGYNRSNNVSIISIGILGGTASTTSSLEVLNINSTASKVMHGTYYGGDYAGWFGGFNGTSNIFTSLMVLPSVGTLTGGTINIYGYRKP